MKVAIRYGAALVDADGHVAGHDAGATLEFVDGADTVVIAMDVIDSLSIWRTLKANCDEPKLMNFVWWRPRHEQPVPVVLYPAIYLSERKQPQLFLDVVERVVKRTPIKVEARLHESHLISEQAMRLSRRDWTWVGPLTASREDYWEALARTTAFLATANEESYGLEYIEALVAGAVGVFPDRAWVRAILPVGYPFIYRTPAEAEEMLYRAVTDTAACRRELHLAAGGDFAQWLRARHDDDQFEKAIADRVTEWFGD